MTVHPTAVVEPGATLGEGVSVGPHAVIGAGVRLDAGVSVGAGAVIHGIVAVGENTAIHPGAVIGGPPQDFSYAGEPTAVSIGADVVVREHVTVHAGTQKGRGRTAVHDGVYLMAGCHVGHDCVVSRGTVLSNNVLLAGHVTVGEFVLIGGGAAIVQRVRIGDHAFISGLSGVTRDVVPYAYVIGHRGRVDSLNLVGLKRRGFSRGDVRTLLSVYEILFRGEGLFAERLERVRTLFGHEDVVKPILTFIDASPSRPLLQPLPEGFRTGGGAAERLEAGL